MSKFGDLMKGIGKGISKHKGAILIGTAAGGFITTVIFAVKQTPKAMKHIEEKKEELGKEKLTVKETVQACWKDYVIPVSTGVVSTGMAVAAAVVTEKTSKAAAGALTALTISEKTLEETREAIKETVGKNKAADVEAKVAEKHIKEDMQSGRCDYHPLEPGYLWFRDTITGQSFIAKPGDIDRAIDNFNSLIAFHMFGSVAELFDNYQQLERDHMLTTPMLEDLGWNDKLHWHPVPVNVYGHNDELIGVVTEIKYDSLPITRDKADVSRNL